MRISGVIVLTVVLWSTGIAPSFAASVDRTIGVRVGMSGPDKGERFVEYDVYLLHGLPWQWQWPSAWQLLTSLDVALGTLQAAGKAAITGSFAPGVQLRRQGGRLSILANIGMVFVSEHDFGRQALGGPLQFGLYAGARYQLGASVHVSYRYRHLSNAGFFRPNPGMEMHFLGLSYGF